jgi:mannose-6-phosphate isomerase
MSNTPNYPLKFTPALKEKVWGGHSLEKLVGAPETSRVIGEAWLIHESLPIANGALKGQILADVVKAHPKDMLGARGAGFVVDGVPRFPLLAKFLDANDWLSIQLHPNDEQARAREGSPYGKCEFWYVLDAAPDAKIIHGLSETCSPEELIDGAKNGTIKDKFDYVTVGAGDVVINTHGMIHALGPGIRIYELQQSSDITYRLYDWDRPASAGRELHLDQSADVADYAPVLQHMISPLEYQASNGTEHRVLCACQYFAATHKRIVDIETSNTHGSTPHLITVLSGKGTVQNDDHIVDIAPGESVLIPATVGEYRLIAEGELRVIVGYIPNLRHDIVEPMHAIGYSGEQIAQLGGDLSRSDLKRVIDGH